MVDGVLIGGTSPIIGAVLPCAGSGAEGGRCAYPPGGSIRSGSGTGVPKAFGSTGLSMTVPPQGRFRLVTNQIPTPFGGKTSLPIHMLGPGTRDGAVSGKVPIV